MKKGFTLAEILITLGIIGVVAALTIPNLTSIYRKRIVETELKKSYAEIAQVIKRSESENGDAIYWDWPYNWANGGLTNSPDEFFTKYFKPYMKITSSISKTSRNYKTYSSKGNSLTFTQSQNASKWYNLSDGRAIQLDTFTTISGDFNNATRGTVGRFFISTSNRSHDKFIVGKNLFSFTLELRNHQLVPTANGFPVWTCKTLENNRNAFINQCTEPTNNSGVVPPAYCTFLIYCNDWKIPDDYPVKI